MVRETKVDGIRVVMAELAETARFPNNSRVPVRHYREVWPTPPRDPARYFEALFGKHGWGGCWRNGVYAYHHYHSTAHEVLGVYAGEAEILLGGPEGLCVRVRAGDAVFIPAGVAHCRVAADGAFAVVGAYPNGGYPDLLTGEPGERPEADRHIATLPLPARDPILGTTRLAGTAG